MITEKIINTVVDNIASLAKGKFQKRKIQQKIYKTVHEAFSKHNDNLLPLCMDEQFSNQLFILARGQSIHAKNLVDLGANVSKTKQLNLSPPEIINALKNFGTITKKKAVLCPHLTIRCGSIFSKNRRRYHEHRAT